jgi:glycosyltransferase involved in cell wall biosynthesis
MRICLLCKYPPIQGGVSTQCYWAARGLAARGHQVHVVTNANEVEDEFRIRLSPEDLAPGGDYAPAFPETGGFVRVHSTERPDIRRLYYIPMGNPTVTRLATIATDVIRREGCEVIFSYYLEPFGMAAHLAGAWTSVPYVFKHAGSDLHRLLSLEELQTAYLEVLARANRIISRGASLKRLLSFGIAEDRIDSGVVFRLPLDCFHPEVEPLDLGRLVAEAQGTSGPRELDPGAPVLGAYGKVGEYKGSFDLLRAVARLAEEGRAPNLVIVGGGWQRKRLLELARELGVERHLYLLPFMPHWQIPRFIRACDAVVFLERGFPITAHTPGIPEEILACGKCLVLSEEVARKQVCRYNIRDRRNLIVVSDPRETGELAACLRFALEDPERTAAIGRRGREELVGEPDSRDWVGALERLLVEVAGEPPAARKLREPDVASGERQDPVSLLARFFPYTAALGNGDHQSALRKIVSEGSLRGIESHEALVEALGDVAGSAIREVSGQDSLAFQVLRFERRRRAWIGRHLDGEEPAPAAALAPETWPLDTPVTLRGDWEVLEFDFDLESVLTAIDDGSPVAPKAGQTRVLLRPGSMPLWINDATELLLRRLAGGSRTVRELVDDIAGRYGVAAAERPRLTGACRSALEAMYWEGIVSTP